MNQRLTSPAALSLLSALSACSAATPAPGDDAGDPGFGSEADRDGSPVGDAGVQDGETPASRDSAVERDAESADATSRCFPPIEELPDCAEFTGNMLPAETRTGALLQAEDVGEGVRFQGIGQLAIAATRTTADGEVPLVVHLQRPYDTGTTHSAVLELGWDPGGEVELRDVWGTPKQVAPFGANVFALACSTQAGCVVLATDSEVDDTLEVLLEELDDEDPRGVVTTDDSLCVFGAGVRCHDGSEWTQLAEDDAARPLRSWAVHNGVSVVVGDGGRALVGDGSGSLVATDVGSQANLRFATASSEAVVVGHEGGLRRRPENSDTWNHCALDAPVFAILGEPSGDGTRNAYVDSAGHVVHYTWDAHTQSMAYCAYDDLGVDDLIEGDSRACGRSQNPMLLSPSTLWIAAGESLTCIP